MGVISEGLGVGAGKGPSVRVDLGDDPGLVPLRQLGGPERVPGVERRMQERRGQAGLLPRQRPGDVHHEFRAEKAGRERGGTHGSGGEFGRWEREGMWNAGLKRSVERR